jgi:hypothetical protein
VAGPDGLKTGRFEKAGQRGLIILGDVLPGRPQLASKQPARCARLGQTAQKKKNSKQANRPLK